MSGREREEGEGERMYSRSARLSRFRNISIFGMCSDSDSIRRIGVVVIIAIVRRTPIACVGGGGRV